jgi:uncharacterized protein
MKKEIRALKGIEIRQAEGQAPVLVGYAALFNSRSLDLGGFVETIRPGAFARSLKDTPEVLALAHHDSSRPLARRSAGTLSIAEDAKGLRVEITLNDSTAARDILADVRSGNIEGMSFGFSTQKDTVVRKTGELPVRELIDVNLFEVSPVTMPAYPETSIAARSVQAALDADGLTAPLQVGAHQKLNELRERLLTISLPR